MLSYSLLILVSLANVLLGVFVLLNNPKARLNRIFSIFCFTLVSWSIVTFFEDTALSSNLVRLFVDLDFILAVGILYLFLDFCIELSASKLKWLRQVALSSAVIVSILTVLGFIVRVDIQPDYVKFITQPGYPVFIIYALFTLISGLGLLIKKYRSSVGRDKDQIQFIFLGLFFVAISILVTNVLLPNFYNVTPVVTRLGIYSTLFLTAFTTYAIIRHHFMNIKLVVVRLIAYALLIATLIGFYTLVVFGAATFLFDKESVFFQRVIPLVAALFLASTAPFFKRLFDQFTNRLFYRQNYSVHDAINEISNYSTRSVEAKQIQSHALKVINKSIRPEYGGFVMFDKDNMLSLEVSTDSYPVKALQLEGFINELNNLRQKITVSDDLKENSHLKQYMELAHIGVITRLSTSNKSIGFLVLGEKKNGSSYNSQDFQFLTLIANDLALALQNARRYEEIQAFNATLQYKINDATKALKRTNQKLIALDDAKDDFIGMASHQLRTPLTSIKGYISMMLDGDLGKVNPTQRQALKEAFDSSQRMVYLISDFLNVSRIRTGKFTLETGKTDLTRIVSEEIGQLRDMAGLRGQKIIFIPPANFPIVCLDEMKIRQVMMNMIDNAIFYTPKNGTIEITLEKTTNEIIFKVTDSGIGVPLGDQHRLFTKFFRAANAKKARPDGTGLGLFMAQKIIAAQEGKIIFKSTEGQGSTFGFRFPLSKVALKP